MSTSTEFLNPYLYRRLRRVFGDVRVSHGGESMVASVVRDRHDRPQYSIAHWGETYNVTCPFCDGRTSLAVNHRYGQRDGLGRPMTYAAFCSRRECHADRANREKLFDMLATGDGALEEARFRPGRAVSTGRAPIALPEPRTRLDRLPADHEARRYLHRLGLDPDRVGRVYGVGHCGRAAEPLARDRIIIPAAQRGETRGWQALAIAPDAARAGGTASAPRLYAAPGMRAAEAVYNLDRARRYETGVVVATPIDVWRFGTMAASPLGDVWSERQGRALASAFRRRTLVLLVDGAKRDRPSTRNLIAYLSGRLRGRFAAVTIPEARKRRVLDRDDLRALVVAGAGDQGVRVRFEQTA